MYPLLAQVAVDQRILRDLARVAQPVALALVPHLELLNDNRVKGKLNYKYFFTCILKDPGGTSLKHLTNLILHDYITVRKL